MNHLVLLSLNEFNLKSGCRVLKSDLRAIVSCPDELSELLRVPRTGPRFVYLLSWNLARWRFWPSATFAVSSIV